MPRGLTVEVLRKGQHPCCLRKMRVCSSIDISSGESSSSFLKNLRFPLAGPGSQPDPWHLEQVVMVKPKLSLISRLILPLPSQGLQGSLIDNHPRRGIYPRPLEFDIPVQVFSILL